MHFVQDRGVAPAGLPDYLDLSVGGTLVVGGVGSAISRFGALSDNALDLRVVTGRGATLTCSPTRDPGLFDAVRAGLGQVGVITRATLRLVPAPRQVRRFLLAYPDLATMLSDQRLLTHERRFEGVQGAVLPAPNGGWMLRLDLVKHLSGDRPDDVALLAGLRALPGCGLRRGDVTIPLARLASRPRPATCAGSSTSSTHSVAEPSPHDVDRQNSDYIELTRDPSPAPVGADDGGGAGAGGAAHRLVVRQ